MCSFYWFWFIPDRKSGSLWYGPKSTIIRKKYGRHQFVCTWEFANRPNHLNFFAILFRFYCSECKFRYIKVIATINPLSCSNWHCFYVVLIANMLYFILPNVYCRAGVVPTGEGARKVFQLPSSRLKIGLSFPPNQRVLALLCIWSYR